MQKHVIGNHLHDSLQVSFAKLIIFLLTQRYIFVIFWLFCTNNFVVCFFFTIFAENILNNLIPTQL